MTSPTDSPFRGRRAPRAPVRPRLKPALRRLDRDDHTLQLGVNPLRAVVLTDLEPSVRRFVESLDGTRTLDELIARGDLDEGTIRRVVRMLAEHGVLDDASVRPEPLRGLTAAERERLGPDLDALSLSEADAGDGGLTALERRRAAHIRVYGAGRVGAQIVVLLAASGIGHVCVVDPGPARHEDVVPGGLSFADTGRSREDGAVAAARRVAPGVNAWTGRTASQPADGARRPDLVVLAPVGPLDGVVARELVALGIPHLLVTAGEGVGSVGPLVLPGVTSCLRCLELIRRDRDPSWPMLGARLGGFPAGEIACDTVLSTLVAAHATGQVLGCVDGLAPTVTNSTVDVMPDWHWKKRSWNAHPQCRCSRNQFGPLTMVA
ncbi:ThiF family adenylyltransferase [Sphaerisporangium perillae]|uniref:ThiF family adenylyltransferase n=1 Tax=Sphaerisporangium perillae TaxID=2935860 RepID=UPI00200E0D30|nr:ThiF family adenylyltransferase [Sphaerisporangium perillae]